MRAVPTSARPVRSLRLIQNSALQTSLERMLPAAVSWAAVTDVTRRGRAVVGRRISWESSHTSVPEAVPGRTSTCSPCAQGLREPGKCRDPTSKLSQHGSQGLRGLTSFPGFPLHFRTPHPHPAPAKNAPLWCYGSRCHPQGAKTPSRPSARRAERPSMLGSPPLPGEDSHIPPLYSPPIPRDSRRQMRAAVQVRRADLITPREHGGVFGPEILSFGPLCKPRSMAAMVTQNLPAFAGFPLS